MRKICKVTGRVARITIYGMQENKRKKKYRDKNAKKEREEKKKD